MDNTSLREAAKQVAHALRQAGWESYFVGGCARDLLLGRIAKDFDVVTNAPPGEVIELFPGANLIGAHFGVVLVGQVEVATYRSEGLYGDGRHPDEVRFETDPALDVQRRDFTINALLMDPFTGQIVDLVGGRADLERGVVRAIGKPETRFEEDHLRMLRAVRFAARLGFEIEPTTFAAIRQHRDGDRFWHASRLKHWQQHLCGAGAGGQCGLLWSHAWPRSLYPQRNGEYVLPWKCQCGCRVQIDSGEHRPRDRSGRDDC